MKELKWVQKRIRGMERLGFATERRFVARDYYGNKIGERLEIAVFTKVDDIVTITHYGEIILELDTREKRIAYFGGYADSDRNIINNVLAFYGFKSRASCAGDKLHIDYVVEEYPKMVVWDYVLKELSNGEVITDYEGNKKKSAFLGTVFNLFPSGKYYTAWACSNITEKEAEADEVFREALDRECELHDCWLEAGEGDPCDIFICRGLNDSEKLEILEEKEEVINSAFDNIVAAFDYVMQGICYNIDKAVENEDEDSVMIGNARMEVLTLLRKIIKDIIKEYREDGE